MVRGWLILLTILGFCITVWTVVILTGMGVLR